MSSTIRRVIKLNEIFSGEYKLSGEHNSLCAGAWGINYIPNCYICIVSWHDAGCHLACHHLVIVPDVILWGSLSSWQPGVIIMPVITNYFWSCSFEAEKSTLVGIDNVSKCVRILLNLNQSNEFTSWVIFD